MAKNNHNVGIFQTELLQCLPQARRFATTLHHESPGEAGAAAELLTVGIKASARASHPGHADFGTIRQGGHRAGSLQHNRARAAQYLLERAASHTPAIVVPEGDEHGDRNLGQYLGQHLHLGHQAQLGEVTRDQQQIGIILNVPERIPQIGEIVPHTDVQVGCGGESDEWFGQIRKLSEAKAYVSDCQFYQAVAPGGKARLYFIRTQSARLARAREAASNQSELLIQMTINRAISLRLVAVVTWFFIASVVAQPLQAQRAETLESPIVPPTVTAEAIYVMDTTSGIPLYSKNPDERRPIGSVVKIMTALTTMKWVENPDETLVDIVEYDMVEPGYSTMNLRVGDTVTVTQLLFGLMLPSGGDAANALCRYVGGVISNVTAHPDIACQSFVGEMNTLAAELGLDNSRFTNPDGRDADHAYSSAQDVYLMTEAMMRDSKLMSIVQNNAYQFQSRGSEPHTYAADSTLEPYLDGRALGVPGAIGGKTGSERQAGGNVSLIREVNGGANQVVIVVMGSTLEYDENTVPVTDTRWDDVRAIVSAMDSQFSWTDPSAAGVIPGLSEQLMVWDVTFQSPPAIPVPTAGEITIGFQMQVGPVVNSGEPAGTLFLYYGDIPVGDLPLYQADIALNHDHRPQATLLQKAS